MPITKYCERCGNQYQCRPSKSLERKYCSKECSRLQHIKYPELQGKITELNHQYQKTFIENNPDKHIASVDNRFRKYYTSDKGRAQHMLNNAKARAKRIGVDVTIDKDWIMNKLESGKCEVTGIEFVVKINGGRGHTNNSFSPSIDRIDQKGPYSPDNCRMVVWIYNRARGAFPDDDFEILLNALKK